MTSDITLFVNPTAGRGRGARATRPAARVLRAAGFGVRTVLGEDAPDALRRARQAVAAGTDALIAVGGDGVVSLALQAVAGTTTPLGVVAVGTGNDFARACGLPVRDPEAAARIVAGALKEDGGRPVDLGRVVRGDGTGPSGSMDAGTWFGTVLASGFDSRVNDRGNRMRLPIGRLRYDVAVLAELAALRPLPYRIRLDDGPWQQVAATLIAVGNGDSYGGGMRICGDARMDDGLFDITIVGPCSRSTLLKVFPRVYRGTHLDHPRVTVHRAAKVTLEAAPDGPLRTGRAAGPGITGYADGEPLGLLPLTAETVPGAVRLLGAQ
ncbi:Diacylglycerol kinase [Streptomyces netropsis]|uniref:Diacylglycerol kinase (ATP) n=1 Tax=Streptomyces syringium TaxID=76729 RepID=A0ABS4XZS8_9ACTN|nr:diacylglycerol kinase [Streptomyces syringium]MBP2402024.1 diacylglycerol kinase (ATP) [Streptomyces syringium]SPE48513.1 Diacylglycerol kinase [Streptomyces netropsis]